MSETNFNISFQPKPTNPRFIDLEGQQFERLTVLGYVGKNRHNIGQWLCVCKCGNHVLAAAGELRQKGPKGTQSCGCLGKERVSQARKARAIHWKCRTPIYFAWISMKARCYNPKNAGYANYAQREIKVCDRWRDSFENFFADMGDLPFEGAMLERIDNDGNYSPENCKWATRAEQNNNSRNNRFLTFNGKTQSMIMWSRELNFKRHTLRSRLDKLGWSVERALSTPIRQMNFDYWLKSR